MCFQPRQRWSSLGQTSNEAFQTCDWQACWRSRAQQQEKGCFCVFNPPDGQMFGSVFRAGGWAEEPTLFWNDQRGRALLLLFECTKINTDVMLDCKDIELKTPNRQEGGWKKEQLKIPLKAVCSDHICAHSCCWRTASVQKSAVMEVSLLSLGDCFSVCAAALGCQGPDPETAEHSSQRQPIYKSASLTVPL